MTRKGKEESRRAGNAPIPAHETVRQSHSGGRFAMINEIPIFSLDRTGSDLRPSSLIPVFADLHSSTGTTFRH